MGGGKMSITQAVSCVLTRSKSCNICHEELHREKARFGIDHFWCLQKWAKILAHLQMRCHCNCIFNSFQLSKKLGNRPSLYSWLGPSIETIRWSKPSQDIVINIVLFKSKGPRPLIYLNIHVASSYQNGSKSFVV